MLRLNSSDSTVVPLRFAALALLLANCSPTAEPVGPQGGSTSKGGNTSTNGGTNSGSGGSTSQGNGGTTSTGMGGATTGMGGATAKGGTTGSSNGGTTSSSNGGSTSSSNGGTTSTGSGGTTTTGNGGTTATGSGGATASACAYKGTVGKDSTIFTDGFGTAKTGKWSGYAFAYPFGKATIVPDTMTGTACFKGAQMCASGSIPADDSSGAGIGWNISQMMGASTKGTVALTGSVKVTLAGAATGMRVTLAPPSGGDSFCYTLTAAEVTAGTATIAVASFKQSCWDTTKAVAYAGSMIESIQVVVPGAMAGAKTFDFCVLDIEPG